MLLTPVQLTALGWVILFFCSLYQISEEATSSTGGKVILYTLQRETLEMRKALCCLAKPHSCNWIWGLTTLMHPMTGGDGGPSELIISRKPLINFLRVTQSQNQVAENFHPSNMKTGRNLLLKKENKCIMLRSSQII